MLKNLQKQLKKLEVERLEKYVSMVLGIIVIVLVTIAIFNYFRNYHFYTSTVVTPTIETTEETIIEEKLTKPGFIDSNHNKEKTPITTSSYTVVAGDCLWTIAERAYGNPYRWTEIAKANNLSNPDLIHPGNIFSIPR